MTWLLQTRHLPHFVLHVVQQDLVVADKMSLTLVMHIVQRNQLDALRAGADLEHDYKYPEP